eukprot:COSAG02_NODE_6803_length_3351_cov_17.529520_1_plen_53_part_00
MCQAWNLRVVIAFKNLCNNTLLFLLHTWMARIRNRAPPYTHCSPGHPLQYTH